MKDAKTDSILERMQIATGTTMDNALAKALGVSAQAVSEARRKQKIPPAWAITIAENFQAKLDWIWFGENSSQDKMNQTTREGAFLLDREGNPIQGDEIDSEIVLIPLVKAQLSAGSGSFLTSSEPEQSYGFRLDFLTRRGNIKEMVLMTVAGDSMEPYIKNKDMVLIDQSQNVLVPGNIFAVGFEDMVYLKKVDAIPGMTILSSFNEDYPPVKITTTGDFEDSVRIIGRMIWSCHEW